ncbi:prepilin-type N-terminal cleavage/methylation domain-containing protein [Massilia sp. MS-15]|uniref:prepilin-type N-terminal cleavage/methylation domain-containing protein n=1 Tax=Massilia sp. MS-15 TaxID=2878200 RepID=UPI001CD60A28|nr:prepilin-type N-terminal cleavage/methylation domain-containing protein [Massilia sp. MS-15]MCA1245827.1 prepilin-type N-terminal cleavage/methylation domain-containing protein [Massilia sp. MS-15]
MSTRRAPGRQRGLTMIELIVFIVVISIALVALLHVLGLTSRHSADPLRRKQALMLAEAMLEEVQLARFTYCDPSSDNADTAESSADCTIPEAFGRNAPEPAGSRPYDNINDYVAAAGTPTLAFNNAAGRLADVNGTPLDLAGYTVRLTITPAALGGIAAGGNSADAEVLRIRVTVEFDGDSLALDGYRTRHAPNML